MRIRSLILLSFLLLVSVSLGCSVRRSVATNARSGKNPYHSSSPAALSEHIRTVLKTSQENTAADDEALRQLHQRRPELAQLSERVAASEDDLDSRRQLAAAYLEEGFLAYAFQLYQQVRAKVTDDSAVELALGRIWYEWRDDSLAHQYAERAAVLDPQSAAALELLGRIHLRRNELDRALSAFLSAAKIEPDNASLLANAGYTFMMRGDLRQAKRYLQLAVALNDSLAEAHNNLGIVLARLGERDGALSHFLATNSPAAAFNNLGVVYLAQKRWEDARVAFKQALMRDPDYLKARANLAEAESHLPLPTIVHVQSFGETPKNSR